MALQLNELELAETFRFELRNPSTNAGLGIFLTVYGQGEDEFQNAVHRRNRMRVAAIRKYKQESDIPEDVSEDFFMEFFSAIIKKAEDCRGGTPVDISKQDVIAMFRDRKHQGPALALQAVNVLSDPANFTKG